MERANWVEIGGFWALQNDLQNWLVVAEKGDLGTVVGGISRMGARWFAAYVFHPVRDYDNRYLGDSQVPTIVGWGDDLVGAATGFRDADESVRDGAGPYIEGDFFSSAK